MVQVSERTMTISVSALLSAVTAISAFFTFAKPIVAGELEDAIKKEMAPFSTAFEITLDSNIRNLRNVIAALEFKRDMCGSQPPCWEVRDAQDLTSARSDLAATQRALDGIRASR